MDLLRNWLALFSLIFPAWALGAKMVAPEKCLNDRATTQAMINDLIDHYNCSTARSVEHCAAELGLFGTVGGAVAVRAAQRAHEFSRLNWNPSEVCALESAHFRRRGFAWGLLPWAEAAPSRAKCAPQAHLNRVLLSDYMEKLDKAYAAELSDDQLRVAAKKSTEAYQKAWEAFAEKAKGIIQDNSVPEEQKRYVLSILANPPDKIRRFQSAIAGLELNGPTSVLGDAIKEFKSATQEFPSFTDMQEGRNQLRNRLGEFKTKIARDLAAQRLTHQKLEDIFSDLPPPPKGEGYRQLTTQRDVLTHHLASPASSPGGRGLPGASSKLVKFGRAAKSFFSRSYAPVGFVLAVGSAAASADVSEMLPGTYAGCSERYGAYETVNERCERQYEWNDSTLEFLSLSTADQWREIESFPGMCSLIHGLHAGIGAKRWSGQCLTGSNKAVLLARAGSGSEQIHISYGENGILQVIEGGGVAVSRFGYASPFKIIYSGSSDPTLEVLVPDRQNRRGGEGWSSFKGSLDEMRQKHQGPSSPVGSALRRGSEILAAGLEVAACCQGGPGRSASACRDFGIETPGAGPDRRSPGSNTNESGAH